MLVIEFYISQLFLSRFLNKVNRVPANLYSVILEENAVNKCSSGPALVKKFKPSYILL